MTNTAQSTTNLYQLIKDQIQFLYMMPGERIDESELSGKYGVDQAAVHDVLVRLSNEYLVDFFPETGIYAAKINFGISRECAYLRHILDTKVCTELCRRKADLSNALAMSLSAMEEAAGKRDVENYLRNDNQFHKIIFRTAGHEMTWEIISDSRAHYNRMLMMELSKDGMLWKSMNEHRSIVEYVRQGDRKNLLQLLDVHHDYEHMPERERVLRKEFPVYFENE